jgi:transketolase
MKILSTAGWHVVEIDDHNMEEIVASLEDVQSVKGQPQMVVAHTSKGKGLSAFRANDVNRMHGKPLSTEEAEAALAELGEMYGQPPGGR